MDIDRELCIEARAKRRSIIRQDERFQDAMREAIERGLETPPPDIRMRSRAA